MNNSDAYTYILNNILEYKQMIIANSLWIYSFAKFEKIDEFKGMVELAHHFELISDKEKGELTNLILNDALLVDKYFKKSDRNSKEKSCKKNGLHYQLSTNKKHPITQFDQYGNEYECPYEITVFLD